MTEIKSWLKENQTLVGSLAGFLAVQAIAIVAYATKLETRVSILETRGAAYTVGRMDEMRQSIAVLEEKIERNEASIQRVIEIMTRGLPQGGAPK